MVIVKLKGGLGNQMFQYAVGRAVARKRGARLRLDLGFYRPRGKRRFRLDRFRIAARVASERDLARIFPDEFAPSPWRRLRRACFGARPARIVREERDYVYQPGLAEIDGDVYLDGYWQNERYFADLAGELRAELALREPPRGPNAAMQDRIRGGVSVGVHVRRGDYVSTHEKRTMYDCCGPDYYRRGMDAMRERFAEAEFFVFSDDPDWAETHLARRESVTVVRHNGPGGACEDFRLLRHCRHFVIANSTFSWWAAWLADAPDKVVMAPAHWLKNDEHDATEIVPAAWERIENRSTE